MADKVILLTVHDASSIRKVDFHFWAEVFARRGLKVDFVTVGFSPITLLKSGGRTYPKPYNQWTDIGMGISRYVWIAPVHPFNAHNVILNRLLACVMKYYADLMPKALWRHISDGSVFIVENGAGLLLIPKLRKKFPAARIIYSVCDRISTLNYHPSILAAERAALPLIDLVRVPSLVMKGDYDASVRTAHIPHGIDKALFDKNPPNPYIQARNAISVGDMLFDADAITMLAKLYPDWTFHLFGKKARLDQDWPNVRVYSEVSFDTLIPYLKHADIGLAPYKRARDADYLSQSSLKMIQYTYCRLPIVAPDFAAAGRAHVLSYDPDRLETIGAAFKRAIVFDRQAIDISGVRTWKETIDDMLGTAIL